MLGYVSRRVVYAIFTVWLIVSLAFFALRLTPGDPVEIWLGEYATPDLVELVREKWGLDKSLIEQYAIYMNNVIHGDLGDSLRTVRPVLGLIGRQLPFTVRLVLGGMALSLLLAIPIGLIAAAKRNSPLDMAVMAGSFLVMSIPEFWMGIIVLLVFGVILGWFPVIGAEQPGDYLSYLRHLTLPIAVLGFRGAGAIGRMVRSSMLDVMGEDYVRVARSKGLRESVVLWKHALRTALAPILSLVGVNLVLLLGGAVMIEVVFSRPGIGYLYAEAVSSRDYPMVQGCVMVVAGMVVVVNLLVDLSYGFIDPRIRYE